MMLWLTGRFIYDSTSKKLANVNFNIGTKKSIAYTYLVLLPSIHILISNSDFSTLR